MANSGSAPRGNEGKIGGDSGKGDGQGVPIQMGQEGAWPKSTSVQEEQGEGVLAPTNQLGPLPKPGTAHRENKDSVLRQTGDENPKVKAKLALAIITAKHGPAPPPLWLNTYYNHSSEGEPMDVDEVAWPPMHKTGGEKKETGRDGEEWEGDNDEGEDEEVVEVRQEAKKAQGETRKWRGPQPAPMPIPKYHIPQCQQCQRLDQPCQAQKTAQACYICKFKVACKGRNGSLYDSLGSGEKLSAPEELETAQMGPPDGEQESLKRPSAKKSEKRKGKTNLPSAQQIIQGSLARDTGDEAELPCKKRLAQPNQHQSPDQTGREKRKVRWMIVIL